MATSSPKFTVAFVITILLSAWFGFVGGWVQDVYFQPETTPQAGSSSDLKVVRQEVVEEESAIINAVEKANPAVVSIIITKDLPVIEQFYIDPFNDFFSDDPFSQFSTPFRFKIPQQRQNGTEKREIGGGSGFIISSDGMILTNKHVVDDLEATYTVLLNDERKFDAKVLARDPYYDFAIIKIESNEKFPTLELGDSSTIKVGQRVITIGNALGEYRNTVSVGVVSGLSRSIVAGGQFGQNPEQLSGVIQTDAAINQGNSGGPLLNIIGEVIGINTAIAAGAQNIGFALPINDIKTDLESVQKHGRIIKAYLGIRYMPITPQLKEKNSLPVDNGVLIIRGKEIEDLAVLPGSPADKAGFQENDIILEVDGVKLDTEHDLAEIVRSHKPGDALKFKVLRRGKELEVQLTLEEKPQ